MNNLHLTLLAASAPPAPDDFSPVISQEQKKNFDLLEFRVRAIINLEKRGKYSEVSDEYEATCLVHGREYVDATYLNLTDGRSKNGLALFIEREKLLQWPFIYARGVYERSNLLPEIPSLGGVVYGKAYEPR